MYLFDSSIRRRVHDVAFSPSGNRLAYVAHDSSITIASGPSQPLQVVYTNVLPFVTCVWSGENSVVVAGHDCAPYIVSQNNAQWYIKLLLQLNPLILSSFRSLAGKIDVGKKKEGNLAANSAFNKFKQMDSKGQQGGQANETELSTTHQNTITDIRVYASTGPDTINQVSTSGVDGKLVVWDLMAAGIAGLKL